MMQLFSSKKFVFATIYTLFYFILNKGLLDDIQNKIDIIVLRILYTIGL